VHKVRYAVIGMGWFGERHCQALAGLPNVELVALCDIREARLREMGRQFRMTALYTDHHEMLADPSIGAVGVVTMIEQHAAPTLAALQAGKHVFLEKPMAATVADCRAAEGTPPTIVADLIFTVSSNIRRGCPHCAA
jgi:UDP-N-acetylglucosamine 3-dehydrogenase